MIIEKVSGQTYADFLKKNIFIPLHMNNTFVYEKSSQRENIAHGYGRFGNDSDYDLLTYGEGGIYSSVTDMFKWDQALYTNKIISQLIIKEVFTSGRLNDGSITSSGFDWGIGNYDNLTTYSHAGRYGGFNTYIKRFPKDRNTIIFLTNNDFKNMSLPGNALINILYDKPYSSPKLSIAEEMNRIYKSDGIDTAIQKYETMQKSKDTTYDYSESELNEFGYYLLGLNKTEDAIKILKLNAEAFPSSWNVYDGLGEAYMKHLDKELAIRNYQKSLELNPENSNATSMLQKLRKQ